MSGKWRIGVITSTLGALSHGGAERGEAKLQCTPSTAVSPCASSPKSSRDVDIKLHPMSSLHSVSFSNPVVKGGGRTGSSAHTARPKAHENSRRQGKFREH